MICSYTAIKTEGPTGGLSTIVLSEDEDEIVTLGTIDSVTYIYTPKELSQEQPVDIEFKSNVTLSFDEKEELKRQSYAQMKKGVLRKELDSVGDVHDMIADCMKLIEFNIMLTSRLAADYLGTNEMTDETKQTYSQRNQQFLDSVDSGQVNIRGNIEDVNEMFQRLMVRYSKIQDIVDDSYIKDMKKIGLIG